MNKQDSLGAAALGAIELVIWHLVLSKGIKAEPFAVELERYANMHAARSQISAAQSLRALAALVRGAELASGAE